MRRFFLEPQHAVGNEIRLTGEEAHHAANVLRVRVGEKVAVLDGAGQECHCVVLALEADSVRMSVVARNRLPVSSCRIWLVQALIKGKAMDWVLQKATELGVERIITVKADRSVAQVEEESLEHRLSKWRGIAVEAIKQCGSPWLPKIEAPASVEVCQRKLDGADLVLLASLESARKHPRQWIEQFKQEKGRAPRIIAVWIGPEGDFTPAETNSIESAGALPISLGPLVLRSETAAVYALSVLNYEMQAQD